MDYFYSKIPGENDRKLEKFTNIMYESLEDEVYEKAQNNSDEAERMEFISLFVYFEEVKRGLINGKIKKEILEKHVTDNCLYKSSEIISIINSTNDLFNFHNILMETIGDYIEVCSIEKYLRQALYNIIEEAYGGYLLHIIRYMNLRIEEVKRQKPLCDRIVRLSYIYCFNNGIDYPSNIL